MIIMIVMIMVKPIEDGKSFDVNVNTVTNDAIFPIESPCLISSTIIMIMIMMIIIMIFISILILLVVLVLLVLVLALVLS